MPSTSAGDFTSLSTDDFTAVSAEVVAGYLTVRFTIPLPPDPASVDLLWAFGNEAVGTQPVNAHCPSQCRSGTTLNLLTGAATEFVLTIPRAPFVVAFCILGLLLVAGLVCNTCLRKTPLAETVFFTRLGPPYEGKVPLVAALFDLTIGNALVLVVVVIALISFVALYVPSAQNSFSVASALGWSTTLMMGLVTMPVNRSSVWVIIFAIPFERAIQVPPYVCDTFTQTRKALYR